MRKSNQLQFSHHYKLLTIYNDTNLHLMWNQYFSNIENLSFKMEEQIIYELE